MFYNDKQGFVSCTVGQLKEALKDIPDDHVLSPTVVYDKGFSLSIQTSEEDGQWFVGWIDFASLRHCTVTKGLKNKINLNPAYGPIWSFKSDSITELQNVNTNYPPESH